MSSIGGGDDQNILVTFLILGGGGMILRFLEVIFVFRSLVVPGPAFFRPIFFKFLHAQQWAKIEIIGGMEVKYWGDLQPCIIKTFIKHCLQENVYKPFGWYSLPVKFTGIQDCNYIYKYFGWIHICTIYITYSVH